MKTIGAKLKEIRESKSFTLREIEELTTISNAYLSQLENDKIKNPSVFILYKLAKAYKIDLNLILKDTGIIDKKEEDEFEKNTELSNQLAFSAGELNDNQKKEVLNYINFLKSKND